MRILEVPTDETLRSILLHGSPGFPFECYLDEIGRFKSRCIEWHWHNEFEFSLVLSGSVFCCVESERIFLRTDDGIFVNSGTIHRFETFDDGIMVTLVFSPVFIAEPSSVIWSKTVSPFLTADCTHLLFHRDCQADDGIRKGIQKTYRTAFSVGPARELKIRNSVSQLWENLFDLAWNGLSADNACGNRLIRARLQKMMEYIHGHYNEKISLLDIASAADISRSEALRCFRHVVHTTPISYLNDYRLSRAKDRLQTTSNTISLISEEAGFESASYFCRIFKKKYGVSPKQFRTKHPQAEM